MICLLNLRNSSESELSKQRIAARKASENMAFGGLRGGTRFQLENILTLKVGWLDKMFCITHSI